MMTYWPRIKIWLTALMIVTVLAVVISAFFGGNAAARAFELAIGAWGSAAMTGTVIWALFADEVRALLAHPVLDLVVSNKRPHCYLVGKNAPKSSEDSGAVVEIYGEIKNDSKVTARNCEVFANKIYASTDGADKSYREISSFCQSSFKWLDVNQTSIDVSCSINRYFRLAVIADNSNVGVRDSDPKKDLKITVSKLPGQSVETKGFSDRVHSVRVNLTDRATRREYMCFDAEYRYFILPLRMACSGCAEKRLQYVWIKWNGKKIEDYEKKGFFEVLKKNVDEVRRMLSEEEGMEVA